MKPKIALAGALLLTAPAPLTAEPWIDEARGAVLAQSCCGFGSDKEQGVSINLEALFDSPGFLSGIGAPRPLVGAAIATDSDATSQIYGGLEWRVRFAKRFFAAATAGATIHNGETDRFDPVADADRKNNTIFYGCRVLFRVGGDVGYELSERVSASFHWNHISNAGLCENNEGLDHMGLRLGYRF